MWVEMVPIVLVAERYEVVERVDQMRRCRCSWMVWSGETGVVNSVPVSEIMFPVVPAFEADTAITLCELCS